MIFKIYPLIWKLCCSFYLLLLIVIPANLSAQNKPVMFTDVTSKAGINFKYTIGDFTYKNILESSGSGITVFDFNNDGLMDLYLMNGAYLQGISDPDGKVFKNAHNELYKNNGDGTFTEVSKKAGVGGHQWSEAAGAIDLDNDGYQDLYVLNYGPNIFYHNNGDGTFRDITGSLGLAGPEKLNGFTKWSIGVSFWDTKTTAEAIEQQLIEQRNIERRQQTDPIPTGRVYLQSAPQMAPQADPKVRRMGERP